MNINKQEVLQWIASRSATFLFSLSVAFLAATACLVVLWVDVPNLQERAIEAVGDETELRKFAATRFPSIFENFVVWTILLVWPIVIIEAIFHWCTRPWCKQTIKHHVFSLCICFCPPLRMCARSHEMGGRLWLPGMGWRKGDRRLRRRLERRFSIPMIVIALMIMPILVIEFFMKTQVANYPWLRFFLHVGTGVIWFAFAFEFVLMVSVAQSKLAYCKKHWLDIAIILLPFVSFLRSLRVLRATSLANLLRFPQLTKIARMYRLRGTAIKVLQSLILLKVFHGLVRTDPTRKIDKLSLRLGEIEREAKLIRRQIVQLERQKAELDADTDTDNSESEVRVDSNLDVAEVCPNPKLPAPVKTVSADHSL